MGEERERNARKTGWEWTRSERKNKRGQKRKEEKVKGK